MNTFPDTVRFDRAHGVSWLVALGFVLLALLVFRDVLPADRHLLTMDDNLGELAERKARVAASWLSGWNDGELLGFPAPVPVNTTYLLLYLLPTEFFNNWINAFALVVGSFFLVLFLRRRGVGLSGALLGGLTCFWLGSNFTLVYAGHIGKFGVLLWACVFLWLTEKSVRDRSLPLALLAGGALGSMFLEQADVALFFALALGPYAVFAWWRTQGPDWKGLAGWAGPLFAVAFLLALPALLTGQRIAADEAATVDADDPVARWEFATQWSWPPEESIDFIAPGFTGWRSGEPAGPYVGRMGRSPGWERTGHGFRNFKLENQYLGAIPILFALMAWLAARRQRGLGSDQKRDVWFWSVALLLTLLLSFGKYFPLYAWFYRLPVVNAIRNPNKFLQVFQLALGVLAAYGLEACLTAVRTKAEGRARILRPVFWIAVLAGLALLGWAFASLLMRDALLRSYGADWGRLAAVIVDHRTRALIHGGAMALLAAIFLYAVGLHGAFPVRRLRWAVVALLVVVLFDVFYLARQYVVAADTSDMAANAVIEALRTDPESRVALVSQDGFYNYWLSMLFPYHGVQSINVAQMPRMPWRYQRYLDALEPDPLRYWELGAVGHVLAPAAVWRQIAEDPALRARFELVWSFNIDPDGAGVHIVPADQATMGRHVLLRHRAPHHRYALVAGWEVVADAAALQHLASPGYRPFERVLVAPDQPGMDQLPPATGSGLTGSVERTAYRPGYVHLTVDAPRPALLRVADKHNRHWQARINGEPVALWRVDYLVQGVFVPPGRHEVTLHYAPPLDFSLWLQFLALVMLAGAGAALALKRRSGEGRAVA